MTPERDLILATGVDRVAFAELIGTPGRRCNDWIWGVTRGALDHEHRELDVAVARLSRSSKSVVVRASLDSDQDLRLLGLDNGRMVVEIERPDGGWAGWRLRDGLYDPDADDDRLPSLDEPVDRDVMETIDHLDAEMLARLDRGSTPREARDVTLRRQGSGDRRPPASDWHRAERRRAAGRAARSGLRRRRIGRIRGRALRLEPVG